MANERLRTAMSTRGHSIETLARATDVDPKTVQRWLSGRLPHPRHRWAVAELLGETDDFLWPAAKRTQSGTLGDAAEIVAAFAHRSQVDSSRWWNLIDGAQDRIDLLGYTLYFLPQQHPQFVDTLRRKCEQGCQVRLAVADPASEHVRWRDTEEQEPITIVARIQSTLRQLEPLMDCEGVQVRYQDVPLYNSVFRFDDQMFVTPMLYATPGHAAPLLHLRRLGPGGMFARFEAHFEGVWSASRPIRQDRSHTGIPGSP